MERDVQSRVDLILYVALSLHHTPSEIRAVIIGYRCPSCWVEDDLVPIDIDDVLGRAHAPPAVDASLRSIWEALLLGMIPFPLLWMKIQPYPTIPYLLLLSATILPCRGIHDKLLGDAYPWETMYHAMAATRDGFDSVGLIFKGVQSLFIRKAHIRAKQSLAGKWEIV